MDIFHRFEKIHCFLTHIHLPQGSFFFFLTRIHLGRTVVQWIKGPSILNQYFKIMEASIFPYMRIYIYFLVWASSSSEKSILKKPLNGRKQKQSL